VPISTKGMADQNGTRNGDSPITLATRLSTGPDRPLEEPKPGRDEFPLWVAEDPVPGEADPEPSVDAAESPVPEGLGPAAALRDGIGGAELRVRRLAEEIELVHTEIRLALEAGIAEAEQAARSSRLRFALRERVATSPLARRWLVVAILVALAAVAGSWKAGLLWTGTHENLVLDSGFEATTLRWRPAGLHTDVSRVRELGRRGSEALQVRTYGAGDGEGPAYFEAASIRPGTHYTFSVFTRSLGSAAVYPEIRWRAGDGSLLEASRGPLTLLDQSWRRVVVSGTAPTRTASALLVVGEAAGTSAPVTYLLDDAQLERAPTSGSYVETGDQTGGLPSHPTDLAALLMLVAAGLLAFASLWRAVLVALPLSLAVPPSFASLDSHLPDMTPTRALIIGCFVAAAAGGRLRAPPRWILALGIAYSAVVLVALVRDPSLLSTRLALSLTIGAFAPALLVLAVARERRDMWILAASLTATAVIVSVVALAEWHFDRHWIPLYPGVVFDALERGGHLRARATFPHPIVLGTFLAMAVQPILALMLAKRGIRRIAAGAAAVVVATGLAVTLSRAPWLGGIVGVATFAALSGAWRRWRIIAAVAAALAVLVASPIGAPMRDAAVGLVRPETKQERFVVQVRIDLAKRIGGGGVRTLVSSSLDPAARPAFPAVIEGREVDLGSSIDNTYVRELAQTGLLGLLALFALLIAMMTETIKGALRAGGDLRNLASGLAAAQLVVLVVGLTVGTISFSQVGTAFWLVAGAGIAIGRLDVRASDTH
jgi:O-antigen ligase